MKIAIIGAGNVGSALGRGWSATGEEVLFGIPDPADPKYGSLPREKLRTPPEAARNAEIVVLATPWPATEDRPAGSCAARTHHRGCPEKLRRRG